MVLTEKGQKWSKLNNVSKIELIHLVFIGGPCVNHTVLWVIVGSIVIWLSEVMFDLKQRGQGIFLTVHCDLPLTLVETTTLLFCCVTRYVALRRSAPPSALLLWTLSLRRRVRVAVRMCARVRVRL